MVKLLLDLRIGDSLELEDKMRDAYPYLFHTKWFFEDENFCYGKIYDLIFMFNRYGFKKNIIIYICIKILIIHFHL